MKFWIRSGSHDMNNEYYDRKVAKADKDSVYIVIAAVIFAVFWIGFYFGEWIGSHIL